MRNFTIIDAPQRSIEWFAARAGRLTGSRAKDMLATIKSGEAAARRDLRTQLVVERLTGTPQEDSYINATMQWGIDHEDAAFAAYEALTGQVATRSGFLAHTDLMAGCSLDGHVGDFDGLLEVKCPKSATHLGYLRSSTLPAEHQAQVLHNLWITGASWCDFLSYDPRFPAHLQTVLIHYVPQPALLTEYADKAAKFLDEVQRELASVQGWRALEQEMA